MTLRNSIVEQRLQPSNHFGRDEGGRKLLEGPLAGAQIQGACMIAGDDALRVAACAHEGDEQWSSD